MDIVDEGHLFVAGDGEDVDVVDGMTDHLALADEGVEGDVFPFHLLRLLETEFVGELQHLVSELFEHLAGVTLEDFACLLDTSLVVLIRLLSYARSHTFLDVVVETYLVFACLYTLFGDGLTTGTWVV